MFLERDLNNFSRQRASALVPGSLAVSKFPPDWSMQCCIGEMLIAAPGYTMKLGEMFIGSNCLPWKDREIVAHMVVDAFVITDQDWKKKDVDVHYTQLERARKPELIRHRKDRDIFAFPFPASRSTRRDVL